MPTLKEMIETDFGVDNEKTASDSSSYDPEISKIAESLGLFDDEDVEEQQKTAGDDSMDSLYNELFPEDELLYKEAGVSGDEALEEALGARSYDYFADQFDRRIEKIAAMMEADAAEASISDGNPHGDSRPGQTQPDNHPDDADEAIDSTDPEYTDEVTKGDDNRVVGHYEQKTAMDLAIRKHLLMSELEDVDFED